MPPKRTYGKQLAGFSPGEQRVSTYKPGDYEMGAGTRPKRRRKVRRKYMDPMLHQKRKKGYGGGERSPYGT